MFLQRVCFIINNWNVFQLIIFDIVMSFSFRSVSIMIRRKLFSCLKCVCITLIFYIILGKLLLVVLRQEKSSLERSKRNLEAEDVKQISDHERKLQNPAWLPPRESKIEYEMIDYENAGETKHVLFFTQFWYHKNWGLSNETITKDSPELFDCPYTNCIFTSKRKYLKQTHEYDALIFHQNLGSWYNKTLMEPIKTRSPYQLYIVATQEYKTCKK